jgi:hypothetical protein
MAPFELFGLESRVNCLQCGFWGLACMVKTIKVESSGYVVFVLICG